jgi:hypothetical protein
MAANDCCLCKDGATKDCFFCIDNREWATTLPDLFIGVINALLRLPLTAAAEEWKACIIFLRTRKGLKS